MFTRLNIGINSASKLTGSYFRGFFNQEDSLGDAGADGKSMVKNLQWNCEISEQEENYRMRVMAAAREGWQRENYQIYLNALNNREEITPTKAMKITDNIGTLVTGFMPAAIFIGGLGLIAYCMQK